MWGGSVQATAAGITQGCRAVFRFQSYQVRGLLGKKVRPPGDNVGLRVPEAEARLRWVRLGPALLVRD